MSRPRKKAVFLPDRPTLQAWEDMRIEMLHEIQEGASPPDELLDAAAQVAALPARPPRRAEPRRAEPRRAEPRRAGSHLPRR